MVIHNTIRYLYIWFIKNYLGLIKKKQYYNLPSIRLKNELLQGHSLVCYQFHK